MKICPNCQKEFPDAMRFCQTDGTPLTEVVEQPAEDLLKTTVVRAEDIAQSLPSSDPFKTVVGGPIEIEDSGDLLQLPEEIDPMKTMIATPIAMAPREESPVASELESLVREPEPPIIEPEPPKPAIFEEIRQEIKPESPYSAFDAFQEPAAPLQEPPAAPDDPTVLQPEPPSFSAPDPAPPSFGNVSGVSEPEEDIAATMIQSNWDSAPKVDDSPFSKPSDLAGASPFDAPAAPQSPFDPPAAPQSPFDPPPAPAFDSPFSQPPSFQEPPPVQFGQQFDQMNQGFGNQPLQQSEWAPPAPPEQGWQNQGLGANTPFQPPVAGEGQNKTLAIVSLVLGIVGLCCGIAGIGALITGFMAKNNCDAEPHIYGGRGMALAGMILGGISVLLMIVGVMLNLLGLLAR